LRHFCATHLLELGVSHADVAIQLGHTDGGGLIMSTYGHPSEDAARERVKRAYEANVTRLQVAANGSQKGRKASDGGFAARIFASFEPIASFVRPARGAPTTGTRRS
jgi:hypothetical protein